MRSRSDEISAFSLFSETTKKLITAETTNNFAILLERIKALANLNEKQIATYYDQNDH